MVFILTGAGAIADREVGYRIIDAAKKLGWNVSVFEDLKGNEQAIRQIHPDFIFTNNWRSDIGLRETKLSYKTYVLVAHPIATYFGGIFNFYPQFKEKKFPELKLFNGFVVSAPQISLFKNYIEYKGQKFYGFKGYSSVQRQNYMAIEPKKIVYMGVNWDGKRRGKKFGEVFKTLADRDLAVFYGSRNSWQNLVGNAYKGYFEGSGEAVLNILRENGISLLLHSNQHIKNKTPSSRAFEAAASGAIGISDKHPFVIQHFGNNFLYINTNKSADDIISQIEEHVNWIKNNPEKVHQMTKNAYNIFIKNHTLEQLLLNVAHMHEKILKDLEQK